MRQRATSDPFFKGSSLSDDSLSETGPECSMFRGSRDSWASGADSPRRSSSSTPCQMPSQPTELERSMTNWNRDGMGQRVTFGSTSCSVESSCCEVDDPMPHYGHKFGAPSVRHLASVISHNMSRAGFSDTANIYEIEPTIIRSRGEKVLCPRDGKLGAAYVDCIRGPEHVGLATHMLSYTWSYTMKDITGTLLAFCHDEQLSPVREYVWMCCFCINQHRVNAAETVSFDQFREEFSSRVQGIGRVLALMTPWHSPAYIDRVWCNFEMYSAVTSPGVKVRLLMTPKDSSRLHEVLSAPQGLDKVWHTLSSLRVEDSKASVQEDREHIFKIIEEGPGFDSINSIVRVQIRVWIAAASEAHVNRILMAGVALDDGSIKLCARVGSLLRETGETVRATNLLEEAWIVRKNNGNRLTAETAYLLKQLGVLRKENGRFDGAAKAFDEARYIYEHLGLLATANGALLLDAVGDLYIAQQDDETALTMLSEAMHLCCRAGLEKSMVGAIILRTRGIAKLGIRDLVGAEDDFEDAYQLHEDTNTLCSPMGAILIQCRGECRRQLGDQEACCNALQQAWEIREKTGTMHSPGGKELYIQLLATCKVLSRASPPPCFVSEGSLMSGTRAMTQRSASGRIEQDTDQQKSSPAITVASTKEFQMEQIITPLPPRGVREEKETLTPHWRHLDTQALSKFFGCGIFKRVPRAVPKVQDRAKEPHLKTQPSNQPSEDTTSAEISLHEVLLRVGRRDELKELENLELKRLAVSLGATGDDIDVAVKALLVDMVLKQESKPSGSVRDTVISI